MKPLLKYPGGKTSELGIIMKLMPVDINNYIEPFVGGGAVYFQLNNSKKNFINDKSEELMLLYEYIRSNNITFYKELDIIIENWDRLKELADNPQIFELYIKYRNNYDIDMLSELKKLINIDDVPMFNLRNHIKFENVLTHCMYSKFKHIRINEIKKEKQLDEQRLRDNLECGIKAAYYTYLRDVYNNPKEYNNLSKPRKVAIYLFIREFCFSSMFRFNKKGEFNVPYGGVSYNKKSLKSKKEYFKTKGLRELLRRTELGNKDFYDFIRGLEINSMDFMFLDPPYDTTFNEYDQNAFDAEDQRRLADYLINECKCRFMLIIKKTEFIDSLYRGKGLTIIEESKNYFVSFKNRNKKDVKHLIIMNY